MAQGAQLPDPGVAPEAETMIVSRDDGPGVQAAQQNLFKKDLAGHGPHPFVKDADRQDFAAVRRENGGLLRRAGQLFDRLIRAQDGSGRDVERMHRDRQALPAGDGLRFLQQGQMAPVHPVKISQAHRCALP